MQGRVSSCARGTWRKCSRESDLRVYRPLLKPAPSPYRFPHPTATIPMYLDYSFSVPSRTISSYSHINIELVSPKQFFQRIRYHDQDVGCTIIFFLLFSPPTRILRTLCNVLSRQSQLCSFTESDNLVFFFYWIVPWLSLPNTIHNCLVTQTYRRTVSSYYPNASLDVMDFSMWRVTFV